LGWKGHLAVIYSNPPAVSRDIFNYTRWLRTLYNLAFMDGVSTTSLGNLFQCFTTLMVKKNAS